MTAASLSDIRANISGPRNLYLVDTPKSMAVLTFTNGSEIAS
jgi:hypothetical protein